jgi:hypothetical protein
MAGLCDVQFPPDFEPEPGHFVACWLYDNTGARELHQSNVREVAGADGNA